jgi:tripartite ATP-independent transporter DctP family solute receptor
MTTGEQNAARVEPASAKIWAIVGLIAISAQCTIIIQHKTGNDRPTLGGDSMSMNRRSFMATTAAICLLPAGTVLAADNLILKSSDVHPEGYPTVVAVQVYPSMQLGGEKETLEQTQVGALAMTRVSVGVMGPIVSDLNVFNLPFVFRDIDHMHKVIDGEIGQSLLKKIDDSPNSGLIGLAWMDAGARNIYNSKRPVAKLEDLQGLKIRTMGNPMFVDMANAMGANGVAMGYDQLINALQTGVVDGAENNYPSYGTGQHYNYAPYISTTQHLIIPEIIVFSRKVWDTLSADDQALIRKVAKEAQAEERGLWAAAEQKALDDMKAHHVTLTEITPDEKKRFQAAMKPIWDKYGAQYKDLIEQISAVQ